MVVVFIECFSNEVGSFRSTSGAIFDCPFDAIATPIIFTQKKAGLYCTETEICLNPPKISMRNHRVRDDLFVASLLEIRNYELNRLVIFQPLTVAKLVAKN